MTNHHRQHHDDGKRWPIAYGFIIAALPWLMLAAFAYGLTH